MATIGQKREAERRMQELLESGGLPQPDSVEYGETCIRLFWHEPKLVVVVDIDDLGDLDDLEDLEDLEDEDEAA
jgi:hypothetical protein